MSSKLNKLLSSNRIYNLIPDIKDERDFMFKAEKLKVDKVILPSSLDLSVNMPPILDQESLGSCGPSQISNCMRYCLTKLKFDEFQPSRLYMYYFTRLAEGSPLNQDTGITIRGGLKAIQKYGACSENNWGYNIPKFTEQPNNNCIIAGRSHMSRFRYIRVQQSLINIKQALFAGFPVIIGIKLYNSFENEYVSQTGTVPMPNIKKEACLGGHACSIVGYDDSTQRFKLQNTWSSSWGDKGYFTLPYDYVLDTSLSSDLWIITYFK
jgi:C1A family cysteine protease